MSAYHTHIAGTGEIELCRNVTATYTVLPPDPDSGILRPYVDPASVKVHTANGESITGFLYDFSFLESIVEYLNTLLDEGHLDYDVYEE